MALARMISVDRDALICDMAETYHIYDLRGLPARTLAVLASGLRANSRIVMRLSEQQASMDTMLLAAIADRLGLLVWAQTKDGQRGLNRPASIVEALTENEPVTEGFATPEEFETARRRIIYGGGH